MSEGSGRSRSGRLRAPSGNVLGMDRSEGADMDAFGSLDITAPGWRPRAACRTARGIVGRIAASALLVVVVGGCGLSSGSPAPATDLQKQADLYAIDQIEVKWHKASSTKDVDLMMTLWADDATFTTA